MSSSEEVAAYTASDDKCVRRYITECSTHRTISELYTVNVYNTFSSYISLVKVSLGPWVTRGHHLQH
jgi:hypothetical protein